MPAVSPAERFWAKVNKTETCWLWTASVIGGDRGGYGQFRSGGQGSKMMKAHVWAYLELVGPIPESLQLDHLCRVRNCVRPTHLEPVTQRENAIRGAAAKTECVNGHPYTPDNIYTLRSGIRTCRTCYVAQYTKANARRRAA